MTRLRPAERVVVIEEDGATYVANLPSGPIAVLDDVATLIWLEACAGDRETLVARVSAALEPSGEDIISYVNAFIDRLIDLGMLQIVPD